MSPRKVGAQLPLLPGTYTALSRVTFFLPALITGNVKVTGGLIAYPFEPEIPSTIQQVPLCIAGRTHWRARCSRLDVLTPKFVLD